MNFYILLTVHPNIMIASFFTSLMHKFFILIHFTIFLYMFRALLCSSSGGKIVLLQHLVSSLFLGDCSVHRLREDSPLVTCVLNSHLQRVTIPDAVLIQVDLLKMGIIVLEPCRGL